MAQLAERECHQIEHDRPIIACQGWRRYGFTDEELDFIIHYDINYRMGGELEGDEEEW